MSLRPGDRLGPYEVLGLIGAGGMGEVYRARDTKLDRDVALKTLPDFFANDPERLTRFEREAKVLASLNHPNIAQIYGLEEADGVKALALELVEGLTLADRIAQGPIPLDEALPIAKQIADALEAAHEHGIVHRDLKPANIKVREDGTVKVLDFGLAKALEASPSEMDLANSPTITGPTTQMGIILGTAAYMSPEQAKGRPIDKRTDLWAFGAVLYEMLAGKRAFTGDNVSDTLAVVLMRDPEWEALPAQLPPAIRRLLRRCLERDRRRRLESIADARLEIEETREEAGHPPPDQRRHERGQPAVLAWALASLALGGVIAGLAVRAMVQPHAGPVLRFAIATSDVFPTGSGPLLAFSKDGERLVYSAVRNGVQQLFLRSRNQFEALPIPGTEGGGRPAISPDGQWLGFSVARTLKKVPIAGGPPITVCDCGVHGTISWGPDDTIIFSDSSNRLSSVSASGGTPQPVTKFEGDESLHLGVSFLPGGKAILFVAVSTSRETAKIVVQSLETGERHVLVDGTRPRYLPTGHLVFAHSNALWGVPFEVDQLRVSGEPVPLVDGIRQEPIGAAQFAIGDDGTLAYLPSEPPDRPLGSLSWADRAGEVTPLTPERRDYRRLRVSPGGGQVALEITGEDGRSNIWVLDVPRGTLTPQTTGNALNAGSVWAPDGTRMAYRSQGTARATGVYWTALNAASGEATRLSQQEGLPSSWSADGTLLAYGLIGRGTGQDIWVLTVRNGAALAFLATSANEAGAVFSPDTHWVAYESDASGRDEVYVSTYPNHDSTKQVSAHGGREPRWAADGKELFFLTESNEVMGVPVLNTDSMELGQPKGLFQLAQLVDYDIHPDGRRFAVLQRGGSVATTSQIDFVLNWFEELKAKVPTGR